MNENSKEVMSNRDIADILSETAKLMELHGVNEFKIRSLSSAAFTISRLESPLNKFSTEEIEQIKGIGKSISLKVSQILQTGTLPEYENYLSETPEGVIQMMHIKGIGPKKVALLWKQLGLENPGELLYACNENRLVELKGFGSKTQEQIRKAIEYNISTKGYFHYAALEKIAFDFQKSIEQSGWFTNVSLTGAIRRKCELLQQIELLAACNNSSFGIEKLKALEAFSIFKQEVFESGIAFLSPEGIQVRISICDENAFFNQLFLTTASSGHLDKLKSLTLPDLNGSEYFESEIEIYKRMGLPFIEPELREGLDEIDLAIKNELPDLVNFEDLKGCLHNHSTYSDGLHSLREMAVACKEAGYEYLGICDHSKSAFYANGLSEERILQQHDEIEKLNAELSPFRIFKGIESDILNDGSLDYSDSVLKKFDFIVASVHSGLKMTEEKATDRLLKAISNPYTTILGHPTGRLLLAREGYPIDHKKIIDACAQHNVVIELNAHPYRLDLDWRWIRYALSKNVMISINPDAHQVSGYYDMYYGICVARKGYLTSKMTFNTLSVEVMENYFKTRHNQFSPLVT